MVGKCFRTCFARDLPGQRRRQRAAFGLAVADVFGLFAIELREFAIAVAQAQPACGRQWMVLDRDAIDVAAVLAAQVP